MASPGVLTVSATAPDRGVQASLNGGPMPPPRPSPTVAFDKALDNILKLGSHDLTLQDDSLLVVDRTANKKNRTSGPSTRTIPFHNILWACLAADAASLTIDYAEAPSKSRTTAAQLAIALPAALDLAPGHLDRWLATLLSRAYGPVPHRRRAYVLVNPHAGPGGAVKKWETEARPLFQAARMPLTVVTTEYSGHAAELCAALDIAQHDIIVSVSGDGLSHEVLNGLGRRADARRALARLAVCHIPCGSGNAMACNLYGTHKPGAAALGIVKGVATPMDLVSVTHGDRRTLSFLSQAVGIVAESDLATENLRWMGQARFTWGFLQRFLAQRVYPCDLAVKVEIETKEGIKAHYRMAKENKGGVAPASSSLGGSSEATAASNTGGLPPLQYGTVNDKLPDGWELLPHDKLGNFYCGNMAYMATDTNFFPAALINDGMMDLVTINGDISPAKSLGMLLTVENGRYFDNPLVNYRKISAFRLVPKNQKDGYISIDGERIPFEPFQAEIHPGLATVLTKRGMYEAPGPVGWEKATVSEAPQVETPQAEHPQAEHPQVEVT